MMMFILVSLLAHALAEPPVGVGYAAARSGHDNHGQSNQRSLSQEYGAPALSARSSFTSGARSQFSYDRNKSTPSQEYGTPGFRSASQEYAPPNARTGSQEYSYPNARSSVSQEYGVPNAKSAPSQSYGAPNTRSGLSQEYGPPNARSGLSQEYGVPNARSGPSQEYGLPSSRSLSRQYGTPNLRNAATDYAPSQDYSASSARLSQEYGAPQLRNSQDYKPEILSDSYGAPLQRSSLGFSDYKPSEEYVLPSQRSFEQAPSQKYGQPGFRNSKPHSSNFQGSASGRFNKGATSTGTFQSSFGLRSPSNAPDSASYSAPSARNFNSYSTSGKSISATYLPSSRGVSQTYGAPEERSLSTEYGAPNARGLNTHAYASSFDVARSIPSSKYGAPSARDAMPSEQYGVPEQYDALSSQGYNYAKNALDELLNQEPANYDFGYKVNDYASGSDFGHTESRQENKAEGAYFVVLPDGTKQTVEYEADERGFKPRISVEPADSGLGYDDNAADLTRTSDGPY